MTTETTNVLTTTELANILAETNETTKKAAKESVQQILDLITEKVAEGIEVRLHGFGVFSSKDVEARVGRNPQTGEELQIAATKRVSFRAAKGLKDAVKGQ